MNAIIVIPARYQSSRLPGKPLIELCGISMLRRTFHRCLQAVARENIVVATDDARIEAHCVEFNMPVVMTSETCLTGTDRVAEVAAKMEADFYINVQGDEPVMDPEDITDVLEAAKAHPGEVINGMCAIDDEKLFRSPTIPKVVARPDGRMLYMSRAPIPTSKEHGFKAAQRQVCIYGYPGEALARFAAHGKKTPLEEIEDIEVLRFLEMGFEVRMIPLSDQSVAVDTPDDIQRAEEAIQRLGLINAG